VNDQPITIEEGHWAPVSAGEYDRRLRRISVNLTVVDEVVARFGHARADVIAAIVAHEEVHVRSSPEALPHEEELRARAAAAAVSGSEIVLHIDEVLAGAWT
jgi:hypothetical protein